MNQVDQMIAAELRSWAVKGLWRTFSLEDMASYLDLCETWGVSVDNTPSAPPAPLRSARTCVQCETTIYLSSRPDKIYCSKRCAKRAKKERESQSPDPGQST